MHDIIRYFDDEPANESCRGGHVARVASTCRLQDTITGHCLNGCVNPAPHRVIHLSTWASGYHIRSPIFAVFKLSAILPATLWAGGSPPLASWPHAHGIEEEFIDEIALCDTLSAS